MHEKQPSEGLIGKDNFDATRNVLEAGNFDLKFDGLAGKEKKRPERQVTSPRLGSNKSAPSLL